MNIGGRDKLCWQRNLGALNGACGESEGAFSGRGSFILSLCAFRKSSCERHGGGRHLSPKLLKEGAALRCIWVRTVVFPASNVRVSQPSMIVVLIALGVTAAK